MSVFDIISRVQGADLAQEEERIKEEREQRRLLRLQAGTSGVPIGELLNRLAGTSEDKAETNESSTVTEVKNAPRPQGGFPAPPTGPGQFSPPRSMP